MVFRYPTFQIGVHNSHLDFGVHPKKSLGTRVKLSTIFHTQTDGQAEHNIQTLEYILRACIVDFKGNWDKHLSFLEFAYDNSFHTSISIAIYEALNGRRFRLL